MENKKHRLRGDRKSKQKIETENRNMKSATDWTVYNYFNFTL